MLRTAPAYSYAKKIALSLCRIWNGIRHVVGARHAGQVALDLRIAIEPVLLVLLSASSAASGRYGISSPSTTPTPPGTAPTAPNASTGAAGTGTTGPGRNASAAFALCEQDVVVGGVEGLPDAVQVGLAVGDARRARGLRSSAGAAVQKPAATTAAVARAIVMSLRALRSINAPPGLPRCMPQFPGVKSSEASSERDSAALCTLNSEL